MKSAADWQVFVGPPFGDLGRINSSQNLAGAWPGLIERVHATVATVGEVPCWKSQKCHYCGWLST